MFRHMCERLCLSSISGAHRIPPINAIIHGLMSLDLDGFSNYAGCSKGYNIEFVDEVFGAYNTIAGSILTSGGDNMYLNVTYFDSACAATSGGVDTGCPRVVKQIAVNNDFGKSLFYPWLCIEKALFREQEVKLFAIGCGEHQQTSLSATY